MFPAIVILTFPFWSVGLFYLWVCACTAMKGQTPKQAAYEIQQKKLRNEAIKKAGEDAVRRGFERGQR